MQRFCPGSLGPIPSLIIGARLVRRERMGQSMGFGRSRGETGGNPGKLGRPIRGAQSERLREKRQSGVVDAAPGSTSNVGEGVGCQRIYNPEARQVPPKNVT